MMIAISVEIIIIIDLEKRIDLPKELNGNPSEIVTANKATAGPETTMILKVNMSTIASTMKQIEIQHK